MGDCGLLGDVRRSNSCSGFSEGEFAELRDIAQLYLDSMGLFMKMVDLAGKAAGNVVNSLPEALKQKFEELVDQVLKKAYDAAMWSNRAGRENFTWLDKTFAWANGETWHSIAVTVTGAFGGSVGELTTFVELPVTTTLILRSIQEIAFSHGYDPSDPVICKHCIAVLGLGGSLEGDSDTELGFFGVRFAVGQQTVVELLQIIAVRFGIVVSEKSLAQAAPWIGAAAGGFINFTFIQFYHKMAHVHFRLLAIERRYDPDQVRSCFERIVEAFRERGQ